MTKEEEERMAKVFARVLEERRGIDAEKHANQHRFVELLMEERKQKADRREKIRQQVTGWAVIGTIGAFVATAGYAANHWFEELIKRITH